VDPTPRVSALIVSYNTRVLLLESIASVVNEPGVETIVVDNGSLDGSPQAIAERYPSVRLICSETNLGFAAGMNRAAACARGRYLLLLNSDARLEQGALDLLVELLDRAPSAALVGPRLRYPDGRPQTAAFRFPGLAQVFLDLFPVPRLMDSPLNGRIAARRATRIDHPLGACMLVREAAWQDVGPLDEGYFMYLEEVDWCRRARQHGWQIWYEPRAVAIHHGGSSTRQQPDAMFGQLWRSRLRYYERFESPAYNRWVHLIVRIGLGRAARRANPRRAAIIQSVRRLTL
jgi:N-acetylglucosaminyl-diphospho-decaprenol L-rhamnosyltransferase